MHNTKNFRLSKWKFIEARSLARTHTNCKWIEAHYYLWLRSVFAHDWTLRRHSHSMSSSDVALQSYGLHAISYTRNHQFFHVLDVNTYFMSKTNALCDAMFAVCLDQTLKLNNDNRQCRFLWTQQHFCFPKSIEIRCFFYHFKNLIIKVDKFHWNNNKNDTNENEDRNQ